MTTQVLLPKLGFAMDEAALVEWMAADGSTVKEGQPLYSLESDKSVQEIDSPAAGTLKILVPVGETYKVGTVIAEIS